MLPLKKILIHTHPHQHDEIDVHQHIHPLVGATSKHSHQHSLAYGVGLVHGLAGSGALIVMVVIQTKEPLNGLLYLLIFGVGSIGGMLIAASLFSIPLSKKIMQARVLQSILIMISALLCLVYGSVVVLNNFFI